MHLTLSLHKKTALISGICPVASFNWTRLEAGQSLKIGLWMLGSFQAQGQVQNQAKAPAQNGKCAEAKPGYSTEVMVDGKCISKVADQFNKIAADEKAGGKAAACKNLAFLQQTFLNQAAGCDGSKFNCDPKTGANGKELPHPNGFTAGSNAQEYAIASYGLSSSLNTYDANCK